MNFFKALAGFFIKSKLYEEKSRVADKLQNEITNTNSDFVKGRNAAYLDLLNTDNKSLVKQIDKKL